MVWSRGLKQVENDRSLKEVKNNRLLKEVKNDRDLRCYFGDDYSGALNTGWCGIQMESECWTIFVRYSDGFWMLDFSTKISQKIVVCGMRIIFDSRNIPSSEVYCQMSLVGCETTTKRTWPKFWWFIRSRSSSKLIYSQHYLLVTHKLLTLWGQIT